MKIYHYDDITKEFIKETDAKLDPLELEINKKEVFLIPRNATPIKPPTMKKGKACIFDGEKWTHIKDSRGKELYDEDGNKFVVNSLNETFPISSEIPPPKHLLNPKLENGEWKEKADYKTLRRNEYPDILEFIDAFVKNDQTQLQKYIDDCLKVKQKYPKE